MGDVHRRFRRGELGDRGLGAEAAAGLVGLRLGPRGAQGQQFGGIEPALHVGDLGLDHLERTDRLAEALALLHIGDGRLVGGLGQAHGLRGDADAAGIQHAHGDLEALAVLTDDLVRRGHVILEFDLARRRRADAQLGLGLAAVETGLGGVDHECGDALGALGRIGDRKQNDVLGDRAGGDPALLAVDHIAAVVLFDRLAAHRGGVGAGLRLGQRERADLAAFGDGAHVQLFLRLGAEFEDAVAEQRIVHRHDRRVRAIGLGDLDHRQHVADRVHARAAVFGRHLDAHQPVLAERADVLERKLTGTVVVLGAGRDLFLRDAARHVLNHQLLFCEAEIHGASSR